MKISVHIEADNAREYADALEILIKGGHCLLAGMQVNASHTLPEDSIEDVTDTPAQTEEKKKRRTKAEIEAEKAAAAAVTTTQPESTPEPAKVVTHTITLDQLRNLAMPLNRHSDKAKAAVLDVIKSYGVMSFGQIPEDKFPEVKERLEALSFDNGIDTTL